MNKINYTLEIIDSVTQQLLDSMQGVAVITLQGDLGAGKTTLVQSIAACLGVKQLVTSPTFTYLNQYQTASGLTIYHFDLYRLSSLSAFEHAGFFEYLYQKNSIAIIEWPEIIQPLLTHNVCHIQLMVESLNSRSLLYEYRS